MVQFKALFPPSRERDTVKRLFTYSFNEEKFELPVPKNQRDLVFEVPKDTSIHLELFDVDVANNKLLVSVLDFDTSGATPAFSPSQISVQFLNSNEEGGDLTSEPEEDDSGTAETFKVDPDEGVFKVDPTSLLNRYRVPY